MLIQRLPLTDLKPAPYNPRLALKPGDAVPSQFCELHSGSLRQRAERALRELLNEIGSEIEAIFK